MTTESDITVPEDALINENAKSEAEALPSISSDDESSPPTPNTSSPSSTPIPPPLSQPPSQSSPKYHPTFKVFNAQTLPPSLLFESSSYMDARRYFITSWGDAARLDDKKWQIEVWEGDVMKDMMNESRRIQGNGNGKPKSNAAKAKRKSGDGSSTANKKTKTNTVSPPPPPYVCLTKGDTPIQLPQTSIEIFFAENHADVREMMSEIVTDGMEIKASDVHDKLASLYSNLSSDGKLEYESQAKVDLERYTEECDLNPDNERQKNIILHPNDKKRFTPRHSNGLPIKHALPNAFMYFSVDTREAVVLEMKELAGAAMKNADVTVKLGELYNSMDAEMKASYSEKAEEDKKRYKEEFDADGRNEEGKDKWTEENKKQKPEKEKKPKAKGFVLPDGWELSEKERPTKSVGKGKGEKETVAVAKKTIDKLYMHTSSGLVLRSTVEVTKVTEIMEAEEIGAMDAQKRMKAIKAEEKEAKKVASLSASVSEVGVDENGAFFDFGKSDEIKEVVDVVVKGEGEEGGAEGEEEAESPEQEEEDAEEDNDKVAAADDHDDEMQ